jgi:hypothetical protein
MLNMKDNIKDSSATMLGDEEDNPWDVSMFNDIQLDEVQKKLRTKSYIHCTFTKKYVYFQFIFTEKITLHAGI